MNYGEFQGSTGNYGELKGIIRGIKVNYGELKGIIRGITGN